MRPKNPINAISDVAYLVSIRLSAYSADFCDLQFVQYDLYNKIIKSLCTLTRHSWELNCGTEANGPKDLIASQPGFRSMLVNCEL